MGKLYDKQELSKVLGFNVNKINNMVKKGHILKPKQFFDPSWGRYRHFWSQSDVNDMLKDKVRAREMLTLDGVCQYLGASRGVVNSWFTKGFMQGEVIFGRRMFDRQTATYCLNTWKAGGFKKPKKEKQKAKPKENRKPKQGKNNAKLSKKPQEKTQKVVNKEEMADVTGDNPKRIISIGEMMKLTSKGRSTIVLWSENGTLPKPLRKPNGHILGWTVEQYQEFLKSCGGE